MNDGYEYRERVQQAGETVLGYLARRYPHSTAESPAVSDATRSALSADLA